MQNLFKEHLSQALNILRVGLEEQNIDAVWIHAGEIDYYFLDDIAKPFRVNPDFNYYVPFPQGISCWLYIDTVHKPILYFYKAQDYWQEPLSLPNEFWLAEFEIIEYSNLTEIERYIRAKNSNKIAYIGEYITSAQKYGLSQINPKLLLEHIHYYRAYKSEFEIACLRKAQQLSYLGHQAAKLAFDEGKSEFEINLEFLKVTTQAEMHTPYYNIIAINHHAAILHYTNYRLQPPQKKHSFLIDAGVSIYGWASDITRTFAVENNEFQQLLVALDHKQQQIYSSLKLNTSYVDYHFLTHTYIADLLIEFDFILGMSKEELLHNNITSAFFPHGLGHLLGLKCHDLGGHTHNRHGCLVPPPENYPSLRCTRLIAANMVFTIEPGIYFIEMLLKPWQQHKLAKHFNWLKIQEFYKYGGIRIEDDVFLHVDGTIENMTRDVFK